jgi:fermentation-respiration switch protein FrsA (DUF1100 family)
MLFNVLVFGLAAYALLVAGLYVFQRSLMYFPDRHPLPPASAGLPQAEEIILVTSDHERLVAWHVPPREGRPVVLYFQGNGGGPRHRAERFAALAADGFGLVAVSYRGYGNSTGSPSEDGLIADAIAAHDFATLRYGEDRLVAWGESLGSGVAVALAGQRRLGALVLEAPFTSTADIARRAYPFVPVGFLMKDQFRSLERIGAVTTPTLVMHGELDRTVPIALGERLYAAIRAPKRFVRFARGDHEGLDAVGARDAVLDFLATLPVAEKTRAIPPG